MKNKLHASVIVTYRCNAKCNMCDVWQNKHDPKDEISLDIISKLPEMFFTNITGGEPFVRTDLPDIIEIIRKKTQRIVISTNGFFTKRIIDLCRQYPDLGIRISLEGLAKNNDTIRGISDGFDRALRTLLELRKMGMKDIGFGMTVQDLNCKDLVPLYLLADALGYEFATASLHNSHYFCKFDNEIKDKKLVSEEFKKLIKLLLKSRSLKKWARAYFNYGLINYIKGNDRLLPCDMGKDGFFLDPYGDILACNGMNEKMSMGSLKNNNFDEIWNSKQAENVRTCVKNCSKNCWMIGSVAPAIWKNPLMVLSWIIKNKFINR